MPALVGAERGHYRGVPGAAVGGCPLLLTGLLFLYFRGTTVLCFEPEIHILSLVA